MAAKRSAKSVGGGRSDVASDAGRVATGHPDPRARPDGSLRHGTRSNVPTVALLYDPVASSTDWPFAMGQLPALLQLEEGPTATYPSGPSSAGLAHSWVGGEYRLELIPFGDGGAAGGGYARPDPSALCESYTMVLGRTAWSGAIRRYLTDLPDHCAAARGLLLADAGGPAAVPKDAAPFPERSELQIFDMVVHDAPELLCAASRASTAAATTAAAASTTGVCGHPNAIHGLALDVLGLREGSEGWGDPELPAVDPREPNGPGGPNSQHGHDFDDLTTGHWNSITLLPELWLATGWGHAAATELCGLNGHRAVIVGGGSSSSGGSGGGGSGRGLVAAWPENKLAVQTSVEVTLRRCGVQMIRTNRPERLATLFAKAEELVILPPPRGVGAWKNSETDAVGVDASGTAAAAASEAVGTNEFDGFKYGVGYMTHALLMGLATGTVVRVADNMSPLSAFMHEEVRSRTDVDKSLKMEPMATSLCVHHLYMLHGHAHPHPRPRFRLRPT